MASPGLADLPKDKKPELAAAGEGRHIELDRIIKTYREELSEVTLARTETKDVPSQQDGVDLQPTDPSPHQVKIDTGSFPSSPPPPRKGKGIFNGETPVPTLKKVQANTSSLDKSLMVPEDVWVTAYKHNISESALCRLSNELIEMITSHLSDESKYLLNQLSRWFYRVYCAHAFLAQLQQVEVVGVLIISKGDRSRPPMEHQMLARWLRAVLSTMAWVMEKHLLSLVLRKMVVSSH